MVGLTEAPYPGTCDQSMVATRAPSALPLPDLPRGGQRKHWDIWSEGPEEGCLQNLLLCRASRLFIT